MLANKDQLSNRTKHIDIREQFIRKCVDEGRTEPKKVKSENNSSDIMTKNQPVEIFIQNKEKLMNGEILNKAMIIEADDDQIKRENVTRHT